MNHKVTLAVSAALMSMSVHSATALSAALSGSFDVGDNTLKAAQPVSVNKNFDSSLFAGKRTFTPEKGLADLEYTYIVQLKDPSVALYNGGIQGLAATSPNAKTLKSDAFQSRKLDINAAEVLQYGSYLDSRQQSLIERATAKLGSLDVLKTFKFAINGFAVRLNQSQALELSRLQGVKLVEREKMYEMQTDRGPSLIGAPGVWDGSATDSGTGTYGEGVIVGILDSGINSDHDSFADVADDGYDHQNPYGAGNYIGDCAGTDPTMTCNDKLIGVRSYPVITDVYGDETVFPPGLPRNGEDYDGHGTHVAATAAGNVLRDVPLYNPDVGAVESDGIPTALTFDEISGVAPRANVIAYQVCFPGAQGDSYSGCNGSAILSAQEDAIIDGIDVANYSIGRGPAPNLAWNDAGEIGFLSMRNAGIFVAVAAGNSGPGPETTDKQGPWYTAVAASTHGRVIATPKELKDFTGGDTELDNITGSSNSGGVTASIVYAGDYANSNDPDGDPAQCLEAFPADTFSGEIVVCDRGAIARVQKAINVADGGAAGFVLANLDGGSTTVNSDAYTVPGIHIDATQGNALRTWLATGDNHAATITATEATITYDESTTDQIIGFSSRGPNLSASLLTPYVAAPGVDIYAAYSDQQFGSDGTTPAATDYSFLSGTSMASPHVAGAAALVTGAQPTWSPDMIRSALMMTATPAMTNDDGTPALWFDMGAGRIQVDQAVKAGLVMEESTANYEAANPNAGGEPRSLNIPSITDNNCVGVCTWTRTVTATKAGSWSASGAAITGGLGITVSPASFELAAGESQELTVEIDAFSSPSDVYSFGIVNLTSASSPDLHLPVSVIASNGNLPEEVTALAKRNQDSYLLKDVEAVEITDFTVNSYGLTKATVAAGSVAQDSDNSSPLDDLTDGLFIATADVPEGAKRLVAMTSNSTSPDLDLFLIGDFNGDGIPTADEVVASSATATADEVVDVALPDAAMYWMVVQNWSASAEGATDTFDLTFAVVDGEAGDNLMVDGPSAVAQLTPFDIRVSWDLADGVEGDMYFGAVDLGTSAEDAGNLGLLPVDVMRGSDDVYVISDAVDRAEPGDVLNFSVAVDANFTAEDRDYEISLSLPDGVTLVDGSTDATVDGSTLSWMLTQESLLGAEPTYRVTSNATDAMCLIPFGSGGYIDLAGFGIPLNANIDGDTVTGNFNNRIQLLGTEYNGFAVTDDGFITVGGDVGNTPWVNQFLPNSDAPNGVLAPLWRDMFFSLADGSGVTVASTGGDGLVIIEWDDMLTFFDGVADIMDFQIVVNNDAAPGTPNIIYAYDNVSHDAGDALPLTIGFENINGTAGLNTHFSPYNQNIAPIGSLEADVTSGTRLCLWLEDVDSEPTMLPFSVSVNDDYLGGPLSMLAMSSVPNIPGTAAVATEIFDDVQVEGAPQVTIGGEVNVTMEILEFGELDLPGVVVEPNGDAYDIMWTQVSGPAAVIAGNTLADAVLIAPEVTEDSMVVLEMTATDVNGNASTAVANVMLLNNQAPTVTVTAPSSVEEGATISLSVTTSDPEGDDVSVTINGIAGTSYTTTAPGTNETIVVNFEVVASDGLNETKQTVSVTVTNKSGGSMGWIALLLIPAIWLRRRKLH